MAGTSSRNPPPPIGITADEDLVRRLAAVGPRQRLALLNTTPDGLSPAEAARRLASVGWNDPVTRTAARHLLSAARNFTHTLALLLWFAAGLAFAAGIPELGGAVVAVIVINGVFAAAQEYRAGKVVEGLMQRVAIRARVVRDGVESGVLARELVPGDVMLIRAGDIVPADCALIDGGELAVDLSMITGETVPVTRSSESVAPTAAPVSDIPCFAPAGAAVISGSAVAVVWATGHGSTLGKIASLVEGVSRGESILERQIRTLSWATAVVAVLVGAATLALATLVTETSFVLALTFATGVIVALVPEGLLPTLSVALAMGARRMAARGAAVRRLSAVEIIGSATVICTDKTGTLTENRLSVLGTVPGAAAGDEELLRAAVLCNDARHAPTGFDGDPIDVALAAWALGRGVDLARVQSAHPRLEETPFDAHHRYMTVTCDCGAEPLQYIKGAPEAVIAFLRVQPDQDIVTAIEAATRSGERVLLFGVRHRDGTGRVVGLVRLYDPPRPEVPDAIAACQRAGIRVVMLTGDHPATARSVADQIGMSDTELPTFLGTALDEMPDTAVIRALAGDAIFARIQPEQKLRIVTLLRRSGEVVVVTGDGINDAPALRAADVGVAMGRRGTEVAKQAADIVLADDNFATLVAAIEEGRGLKRNIRRFVSYVFTSNVAEVVPFLCYIFLPVPLPLAVIQALAIDIGTDLIPALALGAEAPPAGSMVGQPEAPTTPILTRTLAIRTFLFFGLTEAVLGLGAFMTFYVYSGWRPFDELDAYSSIAREASTLTFLAIVGGQVGCLFAQRDGPLRSRLSLRSNALVGIGLATELAIAVALVYVPGLNGMFSMAPVHPAWLVAIPLCGMTFLLFDMARREVVAVRGRT